MADLGMGWAQGKAGELWMTSWRDLVDDLTSWIALVDELETSGRRPDELEISG